VTAKKQGEQLKGELIGPYFCRRSPAVASLGLLGKLLDPAFDGGQANSPDCLPQSQDAVGGGAEATHPLFFDYSPFIGNRVLFLTPCALQFCLRPLRPLFPVSPDSPFLFAPTTQRDTLGGCHVGIPPTPACSPVTRSELCG
jgi:hypothetical protein